MSPREVSHDDEAAAFAAYRATACAEADSHFDGRALDAQRERILDRLARLGQTAKVIPFPLTSHGPLPAATVNRRWLSVAAAAGLIIGMVGGQFVRPASEAGRPTAAVPTHDLSQGLPYVQTAGPVAVDDGLLGEIDSAVQLRSATALRALDELTPFREPR